MSEAESEKSQGDINNPWQVMGKNDLETWGSHISRTSMVYCNYHWQRPKIPVLAQLVTPTEMSLFDLICITCQEGIATEKSKPGMAMPPPPPGQCQKQEQVLEEN